MIELLFPENELEVVRPPKMQIGDFYTFKDYNVFGIGQQAVHNSGSSMLKDTPLFGKKINNFITDHFAQSTAGSFPNVDLFINKQVDNLLKFKLDKEFRNDCLQHIFSHINSREFSYHIPSEYLYITLILFFIKEYNFFKSTNRAHDITKSKAIQHFSTEANFLNQYFSLLQSAESINYLSDICYGRYYFLEVHFLNKENPRNVPVDIVNNFLRIQKVHYEDYNFLEQLEIQNATSLSDHERSQINNRPPELTEISGRRSYKINPRISKTVLQRANYKCEINEAHKTFITKKERAYSESHHLIPMAFQDDFLPINLDREENIISLCPTCHRAVHHGSEKEKINRLRILYDNRIKSLTNCGINMSFEEFIKLYL